MRKTTKEELLGMVEAMRQKDQIKEIERVKAVAERAAENRRSMPGVFLTVDEWRKVFGDVRVVWASEGGATIGSPSPAGVKLSETCINPSFTDWKKSQKKS